MSDSSAFEGLATVVRFEAAIFLSALAALVLIQMSTGRINTKGLFHGGRGARGFSVMRVQLLVVTVFGLIFYVSEIVAAGDFSRLPEVPTELTIALGGSNLAYLSGKAYELLRVRDRSSHAG